MPTASARFTPVRPHYNGGGHCWDDHDILCKDEDNGETQEVCPRPQGWFRLDCNHDDYFYAGDPPAGSYLATHWNIANSPFLIGGARRPSPPVDVTATGGFEKIQLQWSVPGYDGGRALVGYTVRVYESGVLVKEVDVTGTSLQDSPVAAATSRSYEVVARHALGEGDPAPMVSAVAQGKPAPPGSLHGERIVEGIRLTWAPPVHTGGVPLVGFEVYRGTGGGMTKIASVGPAAGSFVDPNPPVALATYYVVYAVNSYGQSAPSPQVSCSATGLDASCLNG